MKEKFLKMCKCAQAAAGREPLQKKQSDGTDVKKSKEGGNWQPHMSE